MNFRTIIIIIIFLYIFTPKNIMGFIKDISDLPLWFKSIVVSLVFIMPIWFIILYLYYPVILTYDWFIILLFCFVPTLIWYILSILQGLLIAHLSLSDSKEIEEFTNDKIFWIYLGIEAIFFLIAISIFLIIIHIQFPYFLAILFGYKIIVIIITKPMLQIVEKLEK